MSDKTVAINVRLSEEAHNRVLDYCKIAGMKKAELMRCAAAYYIAQCMPICNKTEIPSHVRGSLSESFNYNTYAVGNKPSNNGSNEVQLFFKEFWVKVKNQYFPERVVATIKNHWDSLKEWGGNPSQLAQLYNDYCAVERNKGREFAHPNAWLAGHGWLNDSTAERRIGHADDVDLDMTKQGGAS